MRTLPKLIFLALMFAGNSYAQLTSYGFMNTIGTYTEITGGTLLGTTNSDDQYFTDPNLPTTTSIAGPGIPIGFSFVFNEIAFDRIGINNNGWIGFGQSALTPSVNMVSSSGYTPLSSTSVPAVAIHRNRIAGLARDLQAQAGSTLRVETIGSSPYRVCVIQFKNYKRYGSAGTGDQINFQIQLNETINTVALVYGSMSISTTFSPGPQVGLGGTLSSEFANRMNSTSWTTTEAGIANTSTMTLSTTVYPTQGLTFTWYPLTSGSLSGKIINCFTNDNIEGVTVTAGDLPPTTTNSEGDYTFSNVPVGVYTVNTRMLGYNSNSISGVVVTANNNTLTNLCLNPYLAPPSDLEASVTGQDVNLTWGVPEPQLNGQWIHWDNGNNNTAIGFQDGGTFSVAARFTIDDLSGYAGTFLTKIRIFAYASGCDFTLKVWIGENAGTLLLSQPIGSNYIAQQWNDFNLLDPVPISGTTELWFGYTVTNPANNFGAGIDAGPPVIGFGDMISFDDLVWETTTSYLGFNGNWNLQGFISYETLLGLEQQLPIIQNSSSDVNDNNHSQLSMISNLYKKPTNIKEVLKLSKANSKHQQNNERSMQKERILDENIYQESGLKSPMSTITGYNVYRDSIKIADNISDQFYDDLNLPAGTYGYTVTTQYIEGESTAAGPVVTEIITCPEPSSLSSYNITSTSAILTWTPGDDETAWEYAIGIEPFFEPTESGIYVNSNTVVVTGLEPGECYFYYVRAICDDLDGNSYWVGPCVFNTPCRIENIPYSTDFSYNNCWLVEYSGTMQPYFWSFANSNFSGGNNAPEFMCNRPSWDTETGMIRLISPELNTTGLTQLMVTFRQSIWDSPIISDCILKLRSSSDGVSWTDEGFAWASGDGHIITETRELIITNNLGATTYIAWEAEGILRGFAAWFIDDVFIEDMASTKSLVLTDLVLEGLYNGGGIMNEARNETGQQFPGFADQISVELHNSLSYGTIEHSILDVNLNTSGNASINNIPASLNGNYYISIKHRNSIETTTANPVSFARNEIRQSFGLPSLVYGSNLLQMLDGNYAIYGGDVNQDGVVDTGDMSPLDNDATSFSTGYIENDVNGDGIVDTADMTIVDNNSDSFTGTVLPSPADLPMVTTAAIGGITDNSAVCGGDVVSQGGSEIIDRGVCWSTSPMPTLSSNYTTDGSGTGVFTSIINDLEPNSNYYVRSYASNTNGTSYGENISFITPEYNSTVTDIEGNVYQTVVIGTQTWMAENLKTTKYRNLENILYPGDNYNLFDINTTGAYAWYDNDISWKDTYGALYNYFAVTNTNGLCPTGWHVPSESEWATLITYLGGTSVAGGKLKETGTIHWISPNVGATDEYGFSALPGGRRIPYYNEIGGIGYWWTTSSESATNAWLIQIYNFSANADLNYQSKASGYSVRCLKDL